VTTDRHKRTPKAVRMPGGLLAWYEEHAKSKGVPVNAALVTALESYRKQTEQAATATEDRA
jgi:LDH2 family malate/lactate/ureidoglycolate dehydrogenase